MEKIIRITNVKDCCGCQACSNICPNQSIEMIVDVEGFWYPLIDLKTCTDCGLCEKGCPILHPVSSDITPAAFACINKNDETRRTSSSGGVFTAIAKCVIERNGIVFGASFDDTFKVIHSWTDTIEELPGFKGSKYVQSHTGGTFRGAEDFLAAGRLVLFSGTPCQVAGLKTYLGKPYGNLLCADFVCHGVPSPKAWYEYISLREGEADAKTSQVAFRNKSLGWNRYSVHLTFENGSQYIKESSEDIYMQAFLKNVDLRPSCYDCKFKSPHRQSDVTLADFWGVESILPEMNDDKGTSLIMINTDLGRQWFDAAKTQFIHQDVSINDAVRFNPSAVMSVAEHPKRKQFFEELGKIPFDILVNKYCADSKAIVAKRKLRKALSKVKRMIT